MHILRPTIFSRTDGPYPKVYTTALILGVGWDFLGLIGWHGRSTQLITLQIFRVVYLFDSRWFFEFLERFCKNAFFKCWILHPKSRIKISDFGILNSRWDTTNILSHASNHFGTRSNRYSFFPQYFRVQIGSTVLRSNVGPPITLGIWSVSHFDGKIIDILWGIKL